MSSQDYNLVATGETPTVPAEAGSGLYGPFELYQLTQGQIARIEAVTFRASIPNVLTEPVSFVVQLLDPSNNVLWQYLTPPFIDPT